MLLHGPSLTLPNWLACDTPMDVANIRLATIVVLPLFIDLVLNQDMK